MKIKCGTDIIEIDRIKASIEENKEKFCDRVYTQNEIEFCENKKNQKYQHYAARFAAKEAAFKAISELLESKYDISWKDIEIINDDNGKPHINILISEISNGIEDIDLSISHCKNYAVANVVVLYK